MERQVCHINHIHILLVFNVLQFVSPSICPWFIKTSSFHLYSGQLMANS